MVSTDLRRGRYCSIPASPKLIQFNWGAVLIYTVTFFVRSRPTHSETARGSLDVAKAIAMAAVEKGTAERAEVRDINKHLMFHYPRTFHAN